MTQGAEDDREGYPRFRPVAEHGLLVEFGDRIDPAMQDRVFGLDKALNGEPFEGFRESVPAYAALLIGFDPLVTDHGAAERWVRGLMLRRGGETASSAPALREVLVCYDDDLAPDLPAVADATGLAPQQVIEAHLAGRYGVAMYGFAPGYAYLAGVPEAIRLPRKAAALRDVSAGSVLIAGPQCLVSTMTAPTGWWIIGRSPTRILTGDTERPFLFEIGDQVRFRRIPRDQLERQDAS